MSNRPNTIIFFTDQQRWDCSALFGCPLDLTPNYDRAALRGTHLAQCISCQPVCAPARACLQTGTYATVNGVWGNQVPIEPDSVSLARLFGEAGYQTGYIGKWHINGTGFGRDQAVPKEHRLGYDYWLAANVFEFCSQPYDCRLFDENDQEVKLPGYRVDATVDAAIRFLARDHDRPFFLMVSILEPHHQNEKFDYVPPHGYRERYMGRWLPPDLASLPGNGARHAGGYFGCVKRCDEAFGRLLEALESLGLRDTTNVLYTSDHGCHFSTRPGIDKRTCHESAVRIPGMLTGPDFDGGGRLDQPVSLIDLPPTLLTAAGIDVPEHFQGRAIQDRLLNVPARDRPETDAFIQFSDGPRMQVGRSLRTSRYKYAITSPPETVEADGTAKRYLESDLYDLEHDPYELCNLVADKAWETTRQELRERLLAKMREIGESEPIIDPPDPGKWNGDRY